MELFDLYTEDRVPTGESIERGMSVPVGFCRLVIHVCVFNSKGEMLIQQRQPFKSGWSDMWDISVGGSAVAGETSRAAAEREALEEIGVKLNLENIRPALTIHFDEGFDDIYAVNKDLDIAELTLQYEEVQAVRWATADEILSMIDDGVFIPYHKNLIELLFFMRNRRGAL